jgi:hypothetical protein
MPKEKHKYKVGDLVRVRADSPFKSAMPGEYHIAGTYDDDETVCLAHISSSDGFDFHVKFIESAE